MQYSRFLALTLFAPPIFPFNRPRPEPVIHKRTESITAHHSVGRSAPGVGGGALYAIRMLAAVTPDGSTLTSGSALQ